MANRALAAKAERARTQTLELGRLEGTKACYTLAPSKAELRAMLVEAQKNTTNTLSVKMVETYRQGNGKLKRPDNWHAKRGNADMRARKDLISSGSPASHIQDVKRERRERPVIKWGALPAGTLIRNGQIVG